MPNNLLRKTLIFLLSASAAAAQSVSKNPSLPSAPGAVGIFEHSQLPPLPAGRVFVLPPKPEAAVMPRALVPLDSDHEYTLPELIDIAEREHQETRIAWQTAQNAALGAGIARSMYLPRVTANIVGGFQGSTGDTSALGLSLKSGTADGSVSAVSIEWLLFDFGGRNNAVGAAMQFSTASRMTVTGVSQRIIHEVCLAYYAYLASRRHVVTAAASLANARDIQLAAESRYANGVGTVIESAQARQATAQARLTQIQAEGAEKDAYASLLAAAGISPLEIIRIAQLPERPLPPEILQPIDGVVRQALSRRPDVQSAYTAEQASQTAIRAAQAQYRPKIFLGGTAAYVSGQLGLTAIPSVGEQLPTLNISGNHWNSTILVGLNVPIFDGHVRENAIKQAKNNATKSEAVLDRVRIDAIREIVASQNALTTSVSAHEAAGVLREATETSYEAALDAYMQGVGTITAALAAQT